MSDPTILAPCNPSLMKYFMTDASDYGLGAVMIQVYEDQNTRPISFTSRKFSTEERKYKVMKREFLAIFHALKKWRFYLHGGPDFILVTYHE